MLTGKLHLGLRCVRVEVSLGPVGGNVGVTLVASTPGSSPFGLPRAARPQAYFFSADFFLGSACSCCDQMRGTESPTARDLNLRLRVWRWEEGRRAVRRRGASSPAPSQPGLPDPLTLAFLCF